MPRGDKTGSKKGKDQTPTSPKGEEVGKGAKSEEKTRRSSRNRPSNTQTISETSKTEDSKDSDGHTKLGKTAKEADSVVDKTVSQGVIESSQTARKSMSRSRSRF